MLLIAFTGLTNSVQDFVGPLRQVVAITLDYLSNRKGDRGRAGPNQLRDIISRQGGRYQSNAAEGGVDFNVYTDATPVGMVFQVS